MADVLKSFCITVTFSWRRGAVVNCVGLITKLINVGPDEYLDG